MSSEETLDLYINEDNDLFWRKPTARGEPVDVGTGAWEIWLTDADREEDDPTASGSLEFIEEDEDEFYWRGTLEKSDAATLLEGVEYFLEMTLDAAQDGFRRVHCVAKYHGVS